MHHHVVPSGQSVLPALPGRGGERPDRHTTGGRAAAEKNSKTKIGTQTPEKMRGAIEKSGGSAHASQTISA